MPGTPGPGSSRPTRVLWVLRSLDVGGLETYLMRVMREADPERFRFDIAYGRSTPGHYAEEARALGCRLIPVLGRPWKLTSTVRLVWILRRERYDVVCGGGGDMAGPAMLAAWIAGVPGRVALYRSGGHHGEDPLRNVRRLLLRSLVLRFATRIVANSVSGLRAYHPRAEPGSGRWHVVANGVDVERFRPPSEAVRASARAELGVEGRFVLVHVGSFRPVKNHPFLLDLVARLRSEVPNATLLLVGRGTEGPDLARQVRDLGVDDHVTTLGLRMDVPRILAAADVFVFPSGSEGMPNALLEAMASGLPVVASAIPGILEHLPGENRPLTFPLGSPEPWVAALADLARDPEARRAVGSVNRNHAVRAFPWSSNVGPFLRCFDAAREPAPTLGGRVSA